MTKTKKKDATPPTRVSALLKEAERTIVAAIERFGLTVPADQILITIQTRGRMAAYGWFAADRWARKDEENKVHEINLSAEHLHEHDMGETLIHELAHAENRHLGHKDCNVNQYHNKKFKTMAERLGLVVLDKHKKYGYGITDLGAPARDFLLDIGFNHEIFKMARLDVCRVPGTARTSLIKAMCGDCGYTIRVTRQWLDVGNPVCPCGGEIEEQ